MNSKHCEWCGGLSSSYYYRFVINPLQIILLDSPMIHSIDKENQVVTLKNGEKYDYSALISPDTAAGYNEIFPHIFCSEKCEDTFVERYSIIYRKDVTVISLKDEGIFNPVVVPVEHINYNNDTCKQCKNNFPNLNKRYIHIKIVSKTIQKANINDKPDLSKYPVVFSDMYHGKQHGNYYLFEIEHNKSTWGEAQFCSNECAFQYTIENDCIIMYKNNILEGSFCHVSPYTTKINEGLGNPYKYRPQKMSRH